MARRPPDVTDLPVLVDPAPFIHNRSACSKSAPPSNLYWSEYLVNDPASLTVTIICIIGTLYIIGLYCIKFYYIRVYVSSVRRSSKMAWVAAIFPVTAMVSIIGICMPRTLQIVDIFIYLYFTRCLFTFVQLIADYFGGELEMAKFLRDDPVALNTLPCCCCCVCLPKKKPSKTLLRHIGILVYQVAILPPLIFFISAIIFVDQIAYGSGKTKFIQVIFPILSVLQLSSILFASYGTQIFTKMAAVSLKDFCIKKQMRFVQLMIIMYNIQGQVFNIAANTFGIIPCTAYMSPGNVASLWNHYVLIFEILILATLAAWTLRPRVNATFDLHESQIEVHAAHRKVAMYEEDYYIHDDELAENVTANAARHRRIRIGDSLLETDVPKRLSFNPFAPRPSLSLYGPGPNMPRSPPPYKASVKSSTLEVPKISLISSGMNERASLGNNRLSISSSGTSGDKRRKASLLDVHHLPKPQISQGPWLQRLPSNSISSDIPITLPKHPVTSISELDEDEVFNEESFEKKRSLANGNKPKITVIEPLPYETPVEPIPYEDSVVSSSETKPGKNPTVSVTEYLI